MTLAPRDPPRSPIDPSAGAAHVASRHAGSKRTPIQRSNPVRMASPRRSTVFRSEGRTVTDNERKDSERLGLFIAIGSGLGATVGVLAGGGPGMAIGVGIGALLGVVADAIVKRSN